MGQASTQELPVKQVEKTKWTMRRLVTGLAPLKDAMKALQVFDTSGAICSLLWVIAAIIALIMRIEVPWIVLAMMIFSGLLHVIEKEMRLRQERFLLANKTK